MSAEQVAETRIFVEQTVQQLVSESGHTLERNYWEDSVDALVQRYVFFINGRSEPSRICFTFDRLSDSANPHNIDDRRSLVDFIKQRFRLPPS